MEKTEREKMLAGELYDPTDAELTAMRLNARKLARRYNNTDEDDPALPVLLSQLVPNAGAGLSLQAPVYFDYGCNTNFGNYCTVNFNLTVLDCCLVQVGDNVMIGPNCTLAAPMHPLHPAERITRQRPDGSLYNLEYAKPIFIGNNCWLASNVTVCGGVTIGEGCVIGAGSVVTHDIPAHSLAAGVPCQVIRPITDADLMVRR